jgi:thiosulfate/3-mercaptopyruvate sulfurtransferase
MLVSTDWLAANGTNAKLVILHVAANRTAYDAGHIPGARFLATSEFAVTRDGIPNELPPVADLKKTFEAAGVSDDSRVILYSEASVLPATRAYFTLDYLGLGDKVALLDGGIEKWKSEGRALSKDAPKAIQGQFTPHPRPELIVPMSEIARLSVTPHVARVIDVRPSTDFWGEKGGHIPMAVNINWMDSQVKGSQVLKPESELRMMYQSMGVNTDRPAITYCNSGMQATQSYFTLKYLGYDAKLYDGSMSEWTAKGGEVEK